MACARARWRAVLVPVLLAGCVALALEVTDEDIRRAVAQYGPEAAVRLRAWRMLLAGPRGGDERALLDAVNRFFNRIPYASDIEHWGKDDYWATPVELLASNGGDCEDYAIAKYLTLRELGVPADRMRITYVKVTGANQANLRALLLGRTQAAASVGAGADAAHMVLAYYPTPAAEPLILDNREALIRPAGQRPDLVPVYSFNGDGLWLAKEATGRGRYAGSATQLEHWRDLLRRLH